MKEYKYFSFVRDKDTEAKLNGYAEQGYTVDSFQIAETGERRERRSFVMSRPKKGHTENIPPS